MYNIYSEVVYLRACGGTSRSAACPIVPNGGKPLSGSASCEWRRWMVMTERRRDVRTVGVGGLGL